MGGQRPRQLKPPAARPSSPTMGCQHCSNVRWRRGLTRRAYGNCTSSSMVTSPIPPKPCSRLCVGRIMPGAITQAGSSKRIKWRAVGFMACAIGGLGTPDDGLPHQQVRHTISALPPEHLSEPMDNSVTYRLNFPMPSCHFTW